MSTKRALLIILGASFFVLAVGGGPEGSDAARALPPVQEPVAHTVTIPYPGRLSDESDQPVADGTYDFTFALYAAETAGEPLWSEVQEDVMVQHGKFSVSLGSIEPLTQDLLADGTRWLSVRVRGPQESEFTTLTPRQRLAAAPAMPDEPSSNQACPHDHFGEQWSGSGNDGLWVSSTDQAGVVGWSDSYLGIVGVSTPYSLVWPSGKNYGVYGYSYSDHGIYGRTLGDWGWISGVYGEASEDHANGVTGWNTGVGTGVFGHSESGLAGYFDGPVQVIGYLTKTGGGFKIDHPMDPANKYLSHSFVESPDMKNVYDGVVVLAEDGAAWVNLPEWFEALNKDFRYQLTCIGGFAPVYIAQEIRDNRFQIAGGEAGLKVSWQVTGIRQDAYAEAHPIPVEEAKPPEEQGTYLHPAEHGRSRTEGLEYQRNRRPEKFETGGR